MKKVLISIILVIAIIAILIVGKIKMDKYRVKSIVHGEDGKAAIENMLKITDEKALTPEGKIQSYEIQKEKLDYNPMGGIMIQMFINGDKNISLSVTVVEDSTTGNYEIATNSRSPKLSDLLVK